MNFDGGKVGEAGWGRGFKAWIMKGRSIWAGGTTRTTVFGPNH